MKQIQNYKKMRCSFEIRKYKNPNFFHSHLVILSQIKVPTQKKTSNEKGSHFSHQLTKLESEKDFSNCMQSNKTEDILRVHLKDILCSLHSKKIFFFFIQHFISLIPSALSFSIVCHLFD